MNLNLPSNISSNPKTLRLVSLFVMFLIIGVVYFISTKAPSSVSPNKNNSQEVQIQSIASAYFIPPKSLTKEVKVRGKVVVSENPQIKATHKIVDSNGGIIIHAITTDDKLKQQEGNIINLVGSIPSTSSINPNEVLNVSYISFK